MSEPMAVRSTTDKRGKAHKVDMGMYDDGRNLVATACSRIPGGRCEVVPVAQTDPKDRCRYCWPTATPPTTRTDEESRPMTALGQLFGQHVPRDRYDDEGAPVGTYCVCGGWEGDYFADGEAGPFDEHLAAVVLAWVGERAGDVAVVAYLCRFDGSVHRRGVHHPGDEPLAPQTALLSALGGPGASARVEVAPGATDELAGAQIGPTGLKAPTYEGDCPQCHEWKFIGHGPLCVDCYCGTEAQR